MCDQQESGMDMDEERLDIIDICDNQTYYSVSLLYLGMIVISAIFIEDLTFIFGVIAAFSESMLNFVFPGLFFLVCSSKV